jgi:hypothetical protein
LRDYNTNTIPIRRCLSVPTGFPSNVSCSSGDGDDEDSNGVLEEYLGPWPANNQRRHFKDLDSPARSNKSYHSLDGQFGSFIQPSKVLQSGVCNSPLEIPTSTATSPLTSSLTEEHGHNQHQTARRNDAILPSLFATRQTPLPELGGMQRCGGCGDVVTFFESVMGPLGKRFHPVCLRCVECGKQMGNTSQHEFTPEGLMRVCCKNCLLDRSEIVFVKK